jgi:hypothetical protein
MLDTLRTNEAAVAVMGRYSSAAWWWPMRMKDAETLAGIQRSSYADARSPVATTWPRGSALDARGLQSFLDRVRYAVLATGRPDGRPQAAPVGFIVDDGKFWIASVSGARLSNVRRVPWASLVVIEGVTVGGAGRRAHTALRAEGSVRIHENGALETVRDRLEQSWRERYDHSLDWAAAFLALAPVRLFSFTTNG